MLSGSDGGSFILAAPKRPGLRGAPKFQGQSLRQRPWSARPPGLCRSSRAGSPEASSAAATSTSASGLPATRTIAPSSSTRPSPSRSAVACGRSSRKMVPAGQHDAAAVALIGVEHNAIDRIVGVPMTHGSDLRRALHVRTRNTAAPSAAPRPARRSKARRRP